MPDQSPEATAAAIESAVESAFGKAPPPPPAPRVKEAQPTPAEQIPEEENALLDLVEGEAEPEQEAAPDESAPLGPEPEFVVEVKGKQEIIKGSERVKELLQKGLDYSRGTEEVARVREQLAAQAQAQQLASKFQQETMSDIASLKAMDEQLSQYAAVDWAGLIDADFTKAMKLQEQRNALKEARNAKFAELNTKHQQFQQGQAQAAQQLRASEEAALLAKLPEWRNSDKALTEKQAIIRALEGYGYQESEIAALQDHRAVLLARDAMKWRELQKNKMEKVRQAREAPPVVKPGAVAAQADPNSRANFAKFKNEFRKQGRVGNHRAQEAALEKVFSRTFK